MRVNVYIGFLRNRIGTDEQKPIVLESLKHWPDLDGYKWFKATVRVPLPTVYETVSAVDAESHDPREDKDND